MKILLVTMEYPPQRGGVGNYYFNLAKELVKNSFEIKVLTRQSSVISTGGRRFGGRNGEIPLKIKGSLHSPSTRYARSGSVEMTGSSQFFYKFFWPRWLKLFFTIRKIIKNEKIDLIWVGQVLPVGEAAYLIKKFFKIPYFVSTHGMDIMLPQKSLRKEKAMRQVLNRAEFITANSQFTRKELLNLGIADEKIEAIYPCSNINNGYRIDDTGLNEIKNKLNLHNKKILLTVGRLVKRKGQGKVIEAMPRLLKQFPDLVYLVIGDGPESPKLKVQSLKLDVDKHVIFLNNISDEELPAYYQIADSFVMPAENLDGDVEGFGIVYLEAALFGLPSIAGKNGGAMEAVISGQTGLLVEPNNQDDLIEKISRLLANPVLCQKLGAAGKIRVGQEFQWDKQAEKLKNRLQ